MTQIPTKPLKRVYNKASNKVTKGATMEQVFASQLVDDTWIRTVAFIVMKDNGPDKVVLWKKSKLADLSNHYEFVDKEHNKLPRFIAI